MGNIKSSGICKQMKHDLFSEQSISLFLIDWSQGYFLAYILYIQGSRLQRKILICESNFCWDRHWRLYKFTCYDLKGSYDVAKKNFVVYLVQCNVFLRSLRFKKHIIFHIPYIIVAPLCPAFLKRIDFYKAHRSEKRWLASYPVCCDWPSA